MTASTTAPGVSDHYQLALGHPVRSFVLTLVGIGTVLLILQWSGFVNPSIVGAGSGEQNVGDGALTFTTAMRNESPLPVEVVEISWPTTNMVSAELGTAPFEVFPDGTTVHYVVEPFEPFTLGPDETAWLSMRVVPQCDAVLGIPSVEVRTASGVQRHVVLDESTQQLGTACGAPSG